MFWHPGGDKSIKPDDIKAAQQTEKVKLKDMIILLR